MLDSSVDKFIVSRQGSGGSCVWWAVHIKEAVDS